MEIARLNLLLKSLYQRALLPKLEDNIRCGNSLISGLPIELSQYFGADWQAKRPFNWEEEFPNIMEEGGFDIVIGNPPYVNVYQMEPREREFFTNSNKFKSPHMKYDIYVLFVERGLQLLKDGGFLGFILPYPVLSQPYARKLRNLILDTCCIECIVDLSTHRVFKEAMVENCILILKKEASAQVRSGHEVRIIRPIRAREAGDNTLTESHRVPQSTFSRTYQQMFRLDVTPSVLSLLQKLEASTITVGELCYISKGIVAYSRIDTRRKADFLHTKPSTDVCVPFVEGKDVARYTVNPRELFLDYCPEALSRPTFPELHEAQKILVRAIAGKRRLMATYDTDGYYADQKLICCVPWHELADHPKVRAQESHVEISARYSPLYVLAILNSQLLDYYYLMFVFGGLSVLPEDIRQLPIRRIDFDNPQDVKMHDDLVALVERMLDLHKRLKEAVGEEEKDLERQIARTDRQIDKLVYELYGITEEERKIIEG